MVPMHQSQRAGQAADVSHVRNGRFAAEVVLRCNMS